MIENGEKNILLGQLETNIKWLVDDSKKKDITIAEMNRQILLCAKEDRTDKQFTEVFTRLNTLDNFKAVVDAKASMNHVYFAYGLSFIGIVIAVIELLIKTKA